jgi:ABC-type branched-subunit amino acid transport system ATPase component
VKALPAEVETPRAPVVLSATNVTHKFGGVIAVDQCDWSLPEGGITALIGPNGAGKSTMVNLISGAIRLQEGRIEHRGTDISRWAPYRIARRGLIRTFQISSDFEQLTVFENLLLVAPDRPGESVFNALLRPGVGHAADRRNLGRAAELLNEFGLYHLRNDYARELSGGQKRLLELARAMMAEPKLLLLDEPMAGINPVLIERISAHLRDAQRNGVTVLLVEHNLQVVDELCDSVTVMVQGKVLASGRLAEVRQQEAVIDAYLGREVFG